MERGLQEHYPPFVYYGTTNQSIQRYRVRMAVQKATQARYVDVSARHRMTTQVTLSLHFYILLNSAIRLLEVILCRLYLKDGVTCVVLLCPVVLALQPINLFCVFLGTAISVSYV